MIVGHFTPGAVETDSRNGKCEWRCLLESFASRLSIAPWEFWSDGHARSSHAERPGTARRASANEHRQRAHPSWDPRAMELEPGPFFVQLGGQGRFSGQISDLAVNQPEAKADPKSRLTYIHRRPRHPPRRGAYISVFRLLYYAYQQWFPLRILRARRGGYGNSPLGLGAPRYFTMGIGMYLVPTWEALYSPWTSAFCFWGPQSNLAFTTAIAAK